MVNFRFKHLKNEKHLTQALILLFVSLSQLSAQSQQWFTYTDGSAVSEVKEYNGTYWISTLGGLVYFTDPNEVYHLDQSNCPVNTHEFSAMDIGADGGIWLGTMKGRCLQLRKGEMEVVL